TCPRLPNGTAPKCAVPTQRSKKKSIRSGKLTS
ncbi:uncharacterized protein METZ01_LOCUS339214, partial [marine metagenome]